MRMSKSRLAIIRGCIVATILSAAALLTVGCRSADGPKQAANSNTSNSNAAQSNVNQAATSANANRSSESGDTAADDFEGTAGITEKKSAATGVATLTDVRTAQHDKFDRAVFEFAGSALPDYHIEYVDRPVRSCGSGEVVPLQWDGYLLVRFVPAHAHTDAGEPTVKDRERRPDLRVLKELKLICDFEAEVSWVMGLASPNRYRAIELSTPPRLVIDIKH
jgi:hypothetical protein